MTPVLLRRRDALVRFLFSVVVLLATQAGHPRAGAGLQGDVPRYRYRVVNSFPHDSRAFTQGLIVKDGFFYESTGQS